MKWVLLFAILEHPGWSLTKQSFDSQAQCAAIGERLEVEWGDPEKRIVWSCTPQVTK